MQLDGKTAIVTGGASGIGKAIATAYVEEGADVVIASRTESAGTEVADEIGCAYVQTDDQVEELVETTVDEFGKLDVMVNNAGIASEAPVEEMELDDWGNVVQTDLDGVMHGTKAALPHLEETDGCIINTASIYGLVGGNFTQQVAVDYVDKGVRVNSICPGFVETPMTEELLETERFYSYVRDNTPMNRPAQPEEIAPLAVFLASDGAGYMTGANIPIDGGWTAH